MTSASLHRFSRISRPDTYLQTPGSLGNFNLRLIFLEMRLEFLGVRVQKVEN